MKTIIFLHTQKSGGVTLKDILARQYDNIFDIKRFIHFERRMKNLKEMSSQEKQSIELIQGHQFFGIHKHLFNDFQYITLLREPVSKVISLYKSYRRKPDCPQHRAAKLMTFREFIENRHDLHFNNGMVRVLSESEVKYGEVTKEHLEEARSNLARYFIVGLTEKFNEAMILFHYTLKWRSYPLYTKASFATGKDCFGEITDETIELIKKDNEHDLALYEFGKTQMQHQLDSVPNYKKKIVRFELLNGTVGRLYIGQRLRRLARRKLGLD